ncbi:MAG: TonB-dependent receptor [Gammaproteobacteria bacterium]
MLKTMTIRTTIAAFLAGLSMSAQAMADTQRVDIPAGSLLTALETLAKQANVDLVYQDAQVRGLRTDGVTGELSPHDAVVKLLQGTPLKVRTDEASNAILITIPVPTAPTTFVSPKGREVEAEGSASANKETKSFWSRLRLAQTDTPSPAPGEGRGAVTTSEGGKGNRAQENLELEEITVTGSRIRGAVTTSPVIVARRDEIESAGLNDLGSFARTLTQNFSGGQNPGVAGAGSQGVDNQNLNSSSALNLRGLGPAATLTLVNGHRVAYDGLAQGVDISAVPLAAVDRVEIVADGASALYGSDAVGGVANVILRRDFEGLVTSARFGASTDGGNEQQQYDGVAGRTWSAGGFMVAANYGQTTAINAGDRSYTRTIDASTTLVPRQEQYGFVFAGHQQVFEALEFAIDAQFNHRKSAIAAPFLPTASVFTNGLYSMPEARSYSVTPSLRLKLAGGWEASLSGTHGGSKSDLFSRTFAQGIESRRTRLVYDDSLDVAELSAEGPIVRLPGGDARLAMGGGYRSVGLAVNVRATRNGVTTTTSDFSPSRDIYFGYGELSVPLVSAENRMALIENLRVNAAWRYENYRGVADVVTPKFGLVYEPYPDISFKASWGKSFKAQTLFQEFQVRQGILFPGTTFFGYPADQAALIVSGGNSRLKPEQATTWNVTMEVRPSFLEGLQIEASYFDVQYRDRVISPLTSIDDVFTNPIYENFIFYAPSNQQIAAEIARLPQGLSNQTGKPLDPATVGAIVDGSLQNAARQALHGVDVDLNYRIDLGSSDELNVNGRASYLASEQQLASGQPYVRLAGTIFDPPHWRGRLGGNWQHSPFELSAFLNYTGGTDDDRLHPSVRVRSFATFDLAARFRSSAIHGLGQGLESILSVANLFNEAPGQISNANPVDPPYDSTNYSVVGRVVSISLTKKW